MIDLFLNLFLHLSHLLLIIYVNDLLHYEIPIGIKLGLASRVRFTSEFFKLCSQSGNFIVELANHGVLGILIDSWLVLNIFGATSVSERADCLIAVVVRRPTVRNHYCFCITAQGVLEDTRQFGVSVWNVGALGIDETANDMAKRGERQVDLGGLLESIACCSRLALPLTTRQVNNIEFAYLDVRLAVLADLGALDCDGKDRVTSRGVLVHIRGANVPISIALLEHVHQISRTLDHKSR